MPKVKAKENSKTEALFVWRTELLFSPPLGLLLALASEVAVAVSVVICVGAKLVVLVCIETLVEAGRALEVVAVEVVLDELLVVVVPLDWVLPSVVVPVVVAVAWDVVPADVVVPV